jgi:hypothetical protein
LPEHSVHLNLTIPYPLARINISYFQMFANSHTHKDMIPVMWVLYWGIFSNVWVSPLYLPKYLKEWHLKTDEIMVFYTFETVVISMLYTCLSMTKSKRQRFVGAQVPPKMKTDIEKELLTGKYLNESDLIRTALRGLLEHQAEA